MEREVAWKSYTDAERAHLEQVSARYRAFLDNGKTERECVTEVVKLAEAKGYTNLEDKIAHGEALKAGDKVYSDWMGKSIMLFIIGKAPMEKGINILGAHIDSPRMDVKQNPLYEDGGLAYLDTHYYGGIKNYQWVALPLALKGVVAKKDGTVVDISLGDDPADPVFCVTDLLPHLGAEQMKKNGREVVEGESLDVLFGSEPLIVEDTEETTEAKQAKKEQTYEEQIASTAQKEAVRAHIMQLLLERYGIEEEDFLSAEIEVVPAGDARDCGLDRSMVIGYGQDDRVCAYTSLVAQLAIEDPARTAVCILVDKEEIGSVGACLLYTSPSPRDA